MKLFQAKTVGHRRIKDSDWYTMFKQLTIIEGEEGLGKTTLVRTLQAINPGEGEKGLEPFRDYPEEVEKAGHRRRVIPGKKTGVFAIFICNEQLRRKLTPIDQVFFETDRIEVGRRLDWSRWINFVEIPSSSRWSEAAPDLECLQDQLKKRGDVSQLLSEYEEFAEIKPTKRIKEELADRLNGWLDQVESVLDEDDRECLDQARFKTNRAARFKHAKKVTADNLPVFIYFNDSRMITSDPGMLSLFLGRKEAEAGLKELGELIKTIIDETDIVLHLNDDGDSPELEIKEADGTKLNMENGGAGLIWLAGLLITLKLSTDKSLNETVLLLDEPGASISLEQRELIAPVIEKLASHCQVIMTTRPDNPLWRDLAANRFSLVDNDGLSALTKIKQNQ